MKRPIRFAASLAAAACLAVLTGPLSSAEKAPTPTPAKTIRAVVVTGGHGFDAKAFPKTFEGHADIAFEIRQEKPKGKAHLFDDLAKWPYDVIVLYNLNRKLSASQRENFLKLLDRGVGLVILHHAIAAYPEWDEYEKILGAKYCLRPIERNGVKLPRSIWKHGVDIAVHVADPNHPITKGMKDFVLRDETYGKWTYHKGSRLLLTTDCPLNNKQLAWVKTCRKSRVFFLQLGHGPEAYRDANYRRLVGRGIRWTAGRLGTDGANAAPSKNSPQ